MGNNTEFESAVVWLSENLTFDVDARVNLFEVSIENLLKNLVELYLSSSIIFLACFTDSLFHLIAIV